MAPPDRMAGVPAAMERFAENAGNLARVPVPDLVAGRGGGGCGSMVNGHESVLDADSTTTDRLYRFLTQFKETVNALGTFAHRAAQNYRFTDETNRNELARAAFDDYTRTEFGKMTGDGLPAVLPSLVSGQQH
ncbi:hypothetical protein F9C11_26505 [Amycolatopsis sp. VS8301801F10]|uniref:hypothetical protein n=1 Tax=Amycolatopsis sp. VS8301801F10 TaxID=2652442 RepID=UPI0038FD3A1A